LPSPTSGSPAKSSKVIQAPPWLIRLLTPLLARHIARGMAEQGLGAEQIAEKMRADLGHPPSADEERMIQAVVERIPPEPSRGDFSQSPPSAWVLVAANLVPVAGVLLWDWNVFALLALFWTENVVVGLFFAARMLCADPADPALWLGKLFMVPFFGVHYGMFTAIHGLFLFMLFGRGDYAVADPWRVLEPASRAATDYGLWLPIGVLVASHGFSFLWNYLYRGEYRSAQLTRLMTKPYGRVVAMHIAIILGGIGVAALGSPVWALLVLLAVKVALDLKAHVKEHSRNK
jgi:hypothetical protein